MARLRLTIGPQHPGARILQRSSEVGLEVIRLEITQDQEASTNFPHKRRIFPYWQARDALSKSTPLRDLSISRVDGLRVDTTSGTAAFGTEPG